ARRRDPSLPRRDPRARARRPPRAPAANALAGPRDGRGLGPGRSGRLPARPVRLLGRRLRPPPRGDAAQRPPPVPDGGRRSGDPLPPRPLAPPRRAAADRHPRLAGLSRGVPRGHRSAGRPARPRRRGRRRLPRRLPLAARL
ncbi:MAG: Epoxide hydrolase, partial [uncultured Solirubrobacterales bacterium]